MSYCYHCFRDCAEGTGPCPHCGYDPAADQGKYPFALPHGSILAGKYITGRVLGQGGFGITYLALDNSLRARVAIKEFMPDSMAVRTAGTPRITVYTGQRQENFQYGMERFLDEAKVLAKFQENPNIVGVRSYFEENGTAYFVMEYIEGVSFKTYIQEHGGAIPWEEAVRILVPVMDALSAVHKEGIIHRDVTPDNIFIPSGGGVKLLDFGSARYSLGDKSRSLDVVLKAGYAPKEQYTRRGRQGPYTDVYSLAACFYSAVTGYLPPESLDRADEDDLVLPSTRGIRILQAVEDVILRGLEVQPADRYQSMEEFRSALDRAVTESAEEAEAALEGLEFVPEKPQRGPKLASPLETAPRPAPEVPHPPEAAGSAEPVSEAVPGGQERTVKSQPVPSQKVKYGVLVTACCVAVVLLVIIAGTFHRSFLSSQPPAGQDREMDVQTVQDTGDSGAKNGEEPENNNIDAPDAGSEGEIPESVHLGDNTEKEGGESQEQAAQVTAPISDSGPDAGEKPKPAEEPTNKAGELLNYVTDQEYSITISYLIKTSAEPRNLGEKTDAASVHIHRLGLAASQGRLLLLTARRESVQIMLNDLKEGIPKTQELRGVYTGEWSDGNPNGQGTFTVITESSYQGVWEGTWKNGTMIYGVCQYSNGNRYEGSLSGGSPGGYGVMVYQNEDRYEGNWEGGMKHGDGTLKCANGDSLTTSWYHDSDTSEIERLETQLQAIEAELEQIDKTIESNIESTFKNFS